MKKSRFAKKMMALILAVVTAVTLMPVNGFMSKVSADETENVKPNYLTFTAKEAGSTITFEWGTGSDVMYSTDGENNWEQYTNGTEIKLDKVGSTVSFKGKNVTTNYYKHFTLKGKIEASGSVTSLTDGEGNKTDVNLSEKCYEYMFCECTSLTTAPELPATTLQPYCYAFMFYGCTSLTTAPELPAEQLASYCYAYMFSECTSLTTAPKLPAKQIASYCYESMFSECTSLTTAPELPAEQLASYCYESMFSECTSLTTAPELPAEQLASYCYEYMFIGCTSLKEAPELKATTLASFCYTSMFSGCTSLKEAPELKATTLASFCYTSMFSGCTSLKEAPELPATNLAESCYAYMFNGCTGLIETPDLPATNLAESCYAYMFSSCTSLKEAPLLPASSLADRCYYSMFSACENLVKAPDLPATDLKKECYAYMFSACKNLIQAPGISAENLETDCFDKMFNYCNKLNIVTDKDEQHSKDWSIKADISKVYSSMFNCCNSVNFGTQKFPQKDVVYYTVCNHKYENNKCIYCEYEKKDESNHTVKIVLPENNSASHDSGGNLIQTISDYKAVVLKADKDHYFDYYNDIEKFNNNYEEQYGIYIASVNHSEKIVITGKPKSDVTLKISTTRKKTPLVPKSDGGAPETPDGYGYIYPNSTGYSMEYCSYNDGEWSDWQDCPSGYRIEVPVGTYKVRYKARVDSYASEAAIVTVPKYVKPKEETPNAVFEATGPDSGILMSVNPSMQYSTDGGATWKKITDSVVYINGVNITNGVKVIRKATEDKDESYAQTITITKADTPTGLKVETKHSVTGNYSKITGFASDKKYEYKKADKGNWTEVFGTDTDTGTLESGNYEVRVKAEGTALASDIITLKVKNDGTVTIKTKLDKTYDGKAVAMPKIESTNATDKGKVKFEFQNYGEPENTYTTDVPKAAGEYTLRVSVAEDDDNFAAVAYANFTISPKLVDIKWTTPDFTFNGKEQKPTATVDAKDICEGDTLNVIVNVYDGGFRGGEHKAEADINNRNYRINSNEAFTYTIKPKKITLTANDKVKHVGEKNPRFDYTADGLVDGFEPVNIAMSIEEGESAGVYKIEVVSLSPEFNPNYEIITVPGKLTIADHTYSDTTYTWSADNTECTAVRKCTYCDKTDTETAKSKAEVTQNNSCTLPELTKYTVSFKNENGTAFKAQTKENVQTKEATGHKWDGGVQTKAPTYTDEGEMTYTCESCGATKTESIEKLKLNEYDILEGADTTHVLKVDEAHAIRVNCEVEYFLDVMVDGKTVDPKYYTVKSGSTIITFTKEFLDSLSVGDHEVKFLFTNGTAKATITAVEKQAQETKPADKDKTDINKPATPQKPAQQTAAPAKKSAANQKKATRTGDDNPAMMVLILMLLGGAGAVGYSLKRRKAQ